MKKKEIHSTVKNQKVASTGDENLDKLKGRDFLSQKIEDANKALHKIKNLPK
jgi:hypothetical protein